ncbi:Ppx/GppA family phosphatase [Hwanghaeella sp.]|uniref:Ppx/GppA phosphatase family protein n=1 Tax=Hwanghaeella sp. TaxID=2605943 RepID=UPI003CCB92CF
MADLLRTAVPPVAVIDIGSNSIRLVIYDSADRAALPIFNEKVLCGLGRDLDRTGELPEEAVVQSISTICRFVGLAEHMGAEWIDMLGTAAVREAKNGPEFVDAVEAACGRRMRVLTGEQEAEYSALGLLSGTPDADGILGDLGGGSVELVNVRKAAIGEQTTLPLGPIRFGKKELGNPSKATDKVDEALKTVPWLSEGKGRTFYAVGGAWRSVARLHMIRTDYPMHIIHHYSIPYGKAVEFLEFVSHLSVDTLSKVKGISKRRVDTLAYAGMLLHRILLQVKPNRVMLSAYGLREGSLYARLTPEQQQEDPLLSACRRTALPRYANAVTGDRLNEWLAPAFPDSSPAEARLRHAACLMADIGRGEHPDYRAEHALMRVMRLPFVGTEHNERAFMALAVAARHSQPSDDVAAMATVKLLLDEDSMARARAIGLGIRLAYTLSGGVSDVLDCFVLRRIDEGLVLEVKDGEGDNLFGEVVERRLNTLAKAMNCPASVRRVTT